MSELFIVYLTLMIVKIFIAIVILKKSIDLKKGIFFELSFVLALNAIGYVILFLEDLGVPGYRIHIIGTIGTGIGIVVALHWINRVFYTNRKSSYKIITIVVVPVIIINVIFSYLNFHVYNQTNFIIFALDRISLGFYVLIFGGWYFYTSAGAYKRLQFKAKIQPWIKMRYKTIMLYSVSFLIIGFSFILDQIIPKNKPNAITIFTLVLFIMYFTETIGEFLAWFMPEKLKVFYNRNYTAEPEEEFSEEEIMMQLEDEL